MQMSASWQTASTGAQPAYSMHRLLASVHLHLSAQHGVHAAPMCDCEIATCCSVALAHMRLDKFNKVNDSVAITRKRLSDLNSSQGDHSTDSGGSFEHLMSHAWLAGRFKQGPHCCIRCQACATCNHGSCF
jgi:type 1 fimbria pilin